MLFHQLLYCSNQFVNNLISALVYVSHNAASYMICQKLFVKCVHCRADSCGLNEYVIAVGVPLNHRLYASDLSLYAFESVEQ